MNFAELLMQSREKSAEIFVTGSSLVKSDPGDIDVVIPYSIAMSTYARLLAASTMTGSAYGALADHTIDGTFRLGSFNFIVVYDKYLPVWQEATNKLRANPELYQKKEARVELFEVLKGRR